MLPGSIFFPLIVASLKTSFLDVEKIDYSTVQNVFN